MASSKVLKKVGENRVIETTNDNGSWTKRAFSASDLADILLKKGIITQQELDSL